MQAHGPFSWRRATVGGNVGNMDFPDSEIVALPAGPTRVSWRRSLRARRVSLRIDPRDGGVIVTLPPRASRRAGLALLMGHADWVSARIESLPSASPLADGAVVPLHGVPHRIAHVPGGRGGAWIAEGEIRVSGEPEFRARRVTDLLRREARRGLAAIVAAKAGQAGLRPGRITVKDTRTRWGSCAANGNLAFSWRLVMAPPYVQDYVAAHEVAHLRHMNHGELFWRLVAELTPHREAARIWLRDGGPVLLRVG